MEKQKYMYEEVLKAFRERDYTLLTLKDEYCKSHNIGLLRIPYWESSNSEQIIKDKLNIN